MDSGLKPGSSVGAHSSELEDRLAIVRRGMKRAKLDGLLVRSADRFLNEYVPVQDAVRQWVSGFSGSMGEAFITFDAAYLAVDGRYWLQADQEVSTQWTVLRATMGTGIEAQLEDAVVQWARASRKQRRLGVNPDRITPRQWDRYRQLHPRVRVVPAEPCPVETARGEVQLYRADAHHWVPPQKGRPLPEVLSALSSHFEKVDAIVLQKLDEIAWLTHLRGSFFPYQATFPAVALVTKSKVLVGTEALPPKTLQRHSPQIQWMALEELWAHLRTRGFRRIGVDPDHNTMSSQLAVEDSRAEVVPIQAPLQEIRARKTAAELAAMKDSFRRADQVVDTTIRWAQDCLHKGQTVTERGFARAIEDEFRQQGAVGLSFRVISAAGKSGAQIHYGNPSNRKRLKTGQLMLVDCGGYFEAGFATDLTRTFLVGKKSTASAEQKHRFTLVLKAAIAGMQAVLPLGSRGAQLDAIIRAPLWAAGLDYNHGTGHGVGVNVHEYPPRVGPSSTAILEPGHVFSVEPGLYDPKFGGIRIENLCTLEPGPKPGFMKVVPLTFCPLDERLIDRQMLDRKEKAFLHTFRRQFRDRS